MPSLNGVLVLFICCFLLVMSFMRTTCGGHEEKKQSKNPAIMKSQVCDICLINDFKKVNNHSSFESYWFSYTKEGISI